MADHVLPAPSPTGEVSTSGNNPEREVQIVETLESYRREAVDARKNGPNPRDAKWEENLNLYWNRWDFSRKADWQAKEVLPEVPAFVDRFAAALKEALVSVPDAFYTVTDPTDEDGDLAHAIKRATDIWLSMCGRNQNGHILSFPAVFEEQVKLGALMACSSVVNWKNDVPGGRVAIESVDPRFVWMDHTYRNLYRIRRVELDRHELADMARAKDRRGKPIFNLPELDRLVTALRLEDNTKRSELTGTGTQIQSPRVPVILDEYLATVLNTDGTVMEKNVLCVVANEQFLVRGPEKNPFWHGRDWLVYAPLVTTPLSVYGRSYMEDFGAIAKTFNELTNMILDAVFTSSLKAFAVVPGLLMNPEQIAEGISPNKLFLLEDGSRPQDFFKDMDMGSLPAEAVQVWQAIKSELREAAGINEIGLGQFAPKGRTSATEISETKQSSSALIRSVAQTIETRILDPELDMVWKTGLQHVGKGNKQIAAAMGPELFAALMPRRRELIKRPITFRAGGISTLIAKARLLNRILQLLQIIGSNELLLREFLRVTDMGRLVELLFELSEVDLTRLNVSDRNRLVREVTEPINAAQDQAEQSTRGVPSAPRTTREAGDAATILGVNREG